MYLIVVGGGKVGFYLAWTLVEEGYEVLIIERDQANATRIKDQLGMVVMQGDGAEFSVLEAAGAHRADVVIATTGDDEDNLIVCQVAKRRFGVGRVIARVNNPKNEMLFKKSGNRRDGQSNSRSSASYRTADRVRRLSPPPDSPTRYRRNR